MRQRLAIMLAGAAVVAALLVIAVSLFGSDGDDAPSAADTVLGVGGPDTTAAAATTLPPTTDGPATTATTATTLPPATTTAPSSTTTTRPEPSSTTSTSRAGTTTTTTTRPGSTTTTINPNTPPTVRITSPSGGTRYVATYRADSGRFAADATFTASFSDPEGDAVTIEWYSSIDGFLGTGTSISARLHPNGDASQPIITAVAVDSTGARSEASRQVIVWIPSDQ